MCRLLCYIVTLAKAFIRHHYDQECFSHVPDSFVWLVTIALSRAGPNWQGIAHTTTPRPGPIPSTSAARDALGCIRGNGGPTLTARALWFSTGHRSACSRLL